MSISISKEDILQDLDNGYIVRSEISDVVERYNAHKAMDIYAEQQATEFLEWVDDTYGDQYEGILWDRCINQPSRIWIERGVSITLKELYQLYLKSKENQ